MIEIVILKDSSENLKPKPSPQEKEDNLYHVLRVKNKKKEQV